jgi:DNA topoisomerase IA
MSKALIIAEKPSVASDLARVLGKFKREKTSSRTTNT